MLTDSGQFNPILYTVKRLLETENLTELSALLAKADISIEQTDYDNWNGGTHIHTVYLNVDVDEFVKHRDNIQTLEATLLEKFSFAARHINNEHIGSILIVPKATVSVDWSRVAGLTTKEKLIADINRLKNIMIAVSTGGPKIQQVNEEYQILYRTVKAALVRLNMQDPNHHPDLWDWYSKWSTTFNSYQERRLYINGLYTDLLFQLENPESGSTMKISIDLTDWERIHRSVTELTLRQGDAKTEEQFQVVGLLSRETITTLAQAVYKPDKHPILDGTQVSKTDAKRMLEAYIAVELEGSSNVTLRKYAKTTLELANELTHKRTASRKDASLCAIATISLINLIGTLEGKM